MEKQTVKVVPISIESKLEKLDVNKRNEDELEYVTNTCRHEEGDSARHTWNDGGFGDSVDTERHCKHKKSDKKEAKRKCKKKDRKDKQYKRFLHHPYYENDAGYHSNYFGIRGRGGPFIRPPLHRPLYDHHMSMTGYGPVFRGVFPRTEYKGREFGIGKQDEHFEINLAYFDADEIRVTVEGDVLTVKAEHVSKADESYSRPSCDVNVHYDVTDHDTESIHALFTEDGMLKINFKPDDSGTNDVIDVATSDQSDAESMEGL